MALDTLNELAEALIPLLTDRLGGSSSTSTGSSSGGTVRWRDINFSDSDLSDIATRPHGALTNRGIDDHAQYVMQAGRAGQATIDAILRVRNPADFRYRWDVTHLGAGGVLINSYDDVGATYVDLYLDQQDLIIRPGGNPTLQSTFGSDGSLTTAPGQETANIIGNLRLSPSGYTGFAGIKHQSLAGEADSFMALQHSGGSTVLNSKAGQALHLKNGNQPRFSLVNDLYWYAGAPSIRTDNYVSQLTGLYLGYNGAIDARYIFADQMHIRILIADLEQALAGLQIISKSVAVLAEPFLVPFPGVTTVLFVEDLPSAPGMDVYQGGDIVNVRQYSRAGGGLDITDCWGQVTGGTGLGNGKQYWGFTRSGTVTYTTISRVGLGSNRQSAFTSNTPNVPTGTTTGDLMIAAIIWAGAFTCTPPAGWALWTNATSGNITQAIYMRLYQSGDPSSWTWTFSGTTASTGTINTFRGFLPALPLDDVTIQANASSTNMVAPGVTAESKAGMAVFFGAIAGDIRVTPPSGYTEVFDLGISGTGGFVATKLLTGSSFQGNQTAVLASAAANVGCQVLLMPNYTAMSDEAGAAYPFTTITGKVILPDLGVSGNGYLEANAVDGIYASNSPYYQVVTWTGHPATGKHLRVRLGNLNGVTDASFSSLAGKYGIYADSAYLKGDLETGGGYVRIYQASGINMEEAHGGGLATTVEQHALQWWPDITDDSGVASLTIGAAKPTSGGFSGYNLFNLDGIPTNGIQAIYRHTIYGQGTGNDAQLYMQGGSQALGALSQILWTADDIVISGRIGDGWKNLTFNTGWFDYASGWRTAQYKKVGDDVEVRGLVKRTSGSATTIGTLPSGYRPNQNELGDAMTDTGIGRLDIDTSGNIVLQSGGVGYVSIKFRFSTA